MQKRTQKSKNGLPYRTELQRITGTNHWFNTQEIKLDINQARPSPKKKYGTIDTNNCYKQPSLQLGQKHQSEK